MSILIILTATEAQIFLCHPNPSLNWIPKP